MWRSEAQAQTMLYRGALRRRRGPLMALRVGIEIETCLRRPSRLRLFVPTRETTITCADGAKPTEFVLDSLRAFYVVPGRGGLYEKVGEESTVLNGNETLRDVSEALEHDIAQLFRTCSMCELNRNDESFCAVHVHMSDPRAGSRNDPAACDAMTYQLLRLWVAHYEERLIELFSSARTLRRVHPRYAFVARHELTPSEQVVAIRKWRPIWDRTQTLNIRGKRNITTDNATKDVRRQRLFRNTDGARIEVRVHDDMLRTHRTPERALSAIETHMRLMADMFVEADRSVTDGRIDERPVLRAFNVYAGGRAKRRPDLSQLPSFRRFREDGFQEVDRARLERQIEAHPYFSKIDSRPLFARDEQIDGVLRDAVGEWRRRRPPRHVVFDLIRGVRGAQAEESDGTALIGEEPLRRAEPAAPARSVGSRAASALRGAMRVEPSVRRRPSRQRPLA